MSHTVKQTCASVDCVRKAASPLLSPFSSLPCPLPPLPSPPFYSLSSPLIPSPPSLRRRPPQIQLANGSAPRYLGPLTRVADVPGRRTLRSAATNRLSNCVPSAAELFRLPPPPSGTHYQTTSPARLHYRLFNTT